jgi:hypothetical protein
MTSFALGLLLILAKLVVLRILSQLPTQPETTTKAA